MILKTHITLSIFIVMLLTMLMFSLKQNFKNKFSTNSNVECGFNSLTEKNFKFSNQFFMIAIIFVIFDMELIAILPIPSVQFNMISMMFLLSIIILLAFSLLMEWLNGLIEWVKS